MLKKNKITANNIKKILDERKKINSVYLNNISKNEFASNNRFLLSVSEDESLLGDEVFERFHNFWRFRLLVILENTGNNDDGGQYNSEV